MRYFAENRRRGNFLSNTATHVHNVGRHAFEFFSSFFHFNFTGYETVCFIVQKSIKIEYFKMISENEIL